MVEVNQVLQVLLQSLQANLGNRLSEELASGIYLVIAEKLNKVSNDNSNPANTGTEQ